ncbi:hypothetical protein G7Y89_g15326 [Cudoniella acicularis]|uniref:DUF7730 domain-containing protein n=1 Tax=Cudoniella acicularis TaxID=354080 RepID=A0A8H4VLY1_9HELO|nr:hypothetical protein G7Y89_g15326 [Cudoniella acicularis]
MASFSGDEDIANAFLDLSPSSTSDAEPLSAQNKGGNRLSDQGVQTTSLSPGTTTPSTSEAKHGLTFLSLPVEIRLRIYYLLLIRRSCPHTPRCLHAAMELRILQTCKQIYNEAVSILYSENKFQVSEPKEILKLARVRPENFESIRRMDIQVPWTAELDSWLELLENWVGGMGYG